MAAMTPFIFGGFYDVPRYIYIQHRGIHFVLQSEFDEDIDEYTTEYSIYVVPESGHSLTPFSPEFLSIPMACVGRIPINQVMFDARRREELDASILDDFVVKLTGNSPPLPR